MLVLLESPGIPRDEREGVTPCSVFYVPKTDEKKFPVPSLLLGAGACAVRTINPAVSSKHGSGIRLTRL